MRAQEEYAVDFHEFALMAFHGVDTYEKVIARD